MKKRIRRPDPFEIIVWSIVVFVFATALCSGVWFFYRNYILMNYDLF